jgi:hypothetical protein
MEGPFLQLLSDLFGWQSVLRSCDACAATFADALRLLWTPPERDGTLWLAPWRISIRQPQKQIVSDLVVPVKIVA